MVKKIKSEKEYTEGISIKENKILAKLTAKGYEAYDIRKVMQSLMDSGEINFKNNAYRLIEKKLPSGATSDEKKTLLYKNGYKI